MFGLTSHESCSLPVQLGDQLVLEILCPVNRIKSPSDELHIQRQADRQNTDKHSDRQTDRRQTDGQRHRERERVAPKLIKKVEFIWRLSQIRNIYNYWHIKAETDLYKDREEKVLEIGSVKVNFDMYFFIPFRKNVGATHE